MNFYLIIFVLLILDGIRSLELEDFEKMKSKELRKFLNKRGLSCTGCSEKQEFVKMCLENKDVEEIAEKEPVQNASNDNNNDVKDKSVDDIMDELRKAGLSGNVFSASDFDNMNPEEMQNMFKTGSKNSNNRNNKKRKKTPSTTKIEEEEEDEIEL